MRVGIVTLYTDSSNYGGLLQAYALEHYLNNNGISAEQICFKQGKAWKRERLNEAIKNVDVITIVGTLFRLICRKSRFITNRIINRLFNADKYISSRINAVSDFRDNHIKHSEKVFYEYADNDISGYDAFITGSDQVWHGIIKGFPLSSMTFLLFVNPPVRKISYAASISLPNIPKGTEDKVYNALKDYTAISVREKTDKRNLDKIMKGKPVEWVLDPTLLLDLNEWNNVATNGVEINEPYIFAYFLGNSSSQRKCVERFAREKGLIIVNIPYLLNSYRSCDRTFGDIRVSDVSPSLWISLIRNAQFVFTDSFHGSVFSILYHKEFFAFKRERDNNKNMNSRIYDLFEIFGLGDRLICDTAKPNDINSISKIDYQEVDKMLEDERKRSSDFLMNALDK